MLGMKERLTIKSPNASITIPWSEDSFGDSSLSELERLAHGICSLLEYYDAQSVPYVLAEALLNWADSNATFDNGEPTEYPDARIGPRETKAFVKLHDALRDYLQVRVEDIVAGVARMLPENLLT